jgi:hypothetical protein
MSIKSKISQAIVDADGTADVVSEVIDLRFNYGIAVQWVITGATLDGTAAIEQSIDGAHWVDLQADTINGAGEIYFEKDAIYYPFLRLRWTNGASTDALINAFICIKGA